MPPRSSKLNLSVSGGQAYIMPQKKPEKIILRTTLTLDCHSHAQLIEVLDEADSKAYTLRELALIGLKAVLDSEDKYHDQK